MAGTSWRSETSWPGWDLLTWLGLLGLAWTLAWLGLLGFLRLLGLAGLLGFLRLLGLAGTSWRCWDILATDGTTEIMLLIYTNNVEI